MDPEFEFASEDYDDLQDPSILDEVLQDFDWDSIEISEDFLQTIVPTDVKNAECATADVISAPSVAGSVRAEDVIAPTTGRKHGRDADYDEEEEIIKFMRSGSLGRIIASTIAAMTPPRSPSRRISETSLDPASLLERDEKRKKIVLNLLHTFNLGDLGRLALFIREFCLESCQLDTPDLPFPIVGLGDITIYFSLLVEIYPDGVYRVYSSLIDRHAVSVSYSFMGRRIFEQPIESLFRQVQMHAMRDRHYARPQRIHEQAEEEVDASDREGVIQIKKLNSNGWARRLNQSQVQPALVRPTLAATVATSSSSSSVAAAAASISASTPGISGSANSSGKAAGAASIAGTSMSPSIAAGGCGGGAAATQISVFQRITEVLNNLIVPNAGLAAADALKKAPLKLKRQIVMEFNRDNQIMRIAIVNTT